MVSYPGRDSYAFSPSTESDRSAAFGSSRALRSASPASGTSDQPRPIPRCTNASGLIMQLVIVALLLGPRVGVLDVLQLLPHRRDAGGHEDVHLGRFGDLWVGVHEAERLATLCGAHRPGCVRVLQILEIGVVGIEPGKHLSVGVGQPEQPVDELDEAVGGELESAENARASWAPRILRSSTAFNP